LVNKLRAYVLQDEGHDTISANEHLGFQADQRDYAIAAHIFRDLGVERLRLMTNNPKKVAALVAHGLEVVERVPVQIEPSAHNAGYLKVKRDRLGHLLDLK
jgi:3,4-dihydroxy 2-butanone 4-phosphate synthase / GTP cyclohydrolase II